ncbi:MAG: hypothetical protein K2I70_02475 [Bacilli bacterium]|nr:hypothetical protein [Bacilli bacterium]
MDRVKEIVKDNIIWIIILLVLIGFIVGYNIYNYLDGKEIYNDPMVTDRESIPYINHTYEANEYRVITVEKYDVINNYYKDFINKMVNNTKLSWDYISEEEKKNRFNDKYEEYEKYVSTITTVKTLSNKVEKYKISSNTITVIDSANNMYEFEENGVWNYKVSFNGQVN